MSAEIVIDGVTFQLLGVSATERGRAFAQAVAAALAARPRSDGAGLTGPLVVQLGPGADAAPALDLQAPGGVDYQRGARAGGSAINAFRGPVVAGADLDPGLGVYLYSDGAIGARTDLYPTPLPVPGVALLYPGRIDDVHRWRAAFPLAVPPQAANSAAIDLPLIAGPNEAEMNGLIAQTFDPAFTGGQFLTTLDGDVVSMRFLSRRTVQVSSIVYQIITAGVTLVNCFLGIRSAAGSQLGVTADLSSIWTSTGVKTTALVAPVTLTAGQFYYFDLLCGSSVTDVGFAASPAGAVATALNINLAAGARRFQVLTGSLSALPASITMSSMTALDAPMPWFGVL